MRESEDSGGPDGGRFNRLLGQLGAAVMAEGMGVEAAELARIQSGAAPLEGGVRNRFEALAKSMGVAVDWWDISGDEASGVELPGVELPGVELPGVRAWARSGSPRSAPR